jgi:hypothetical protein
MQIKALSFLSQLATAAALGAGAAPEYHPVSISVSCKGIDFKSLSAAEDDYSATVLMEAYNKAHQVLDGGDKFLSNVHFADIADMSLEDVEDDNDEDLEEGVLRRPRPKNT